MEELFNVMARLWWSFRAAVVVLAAGEDAVILNSDFSMPKTVRPRRGRMLFLGNKMAEEPIDILNAPAQLSSWAEFSDDSICPICGDKKSPGIRAHYPYCLDRLERRADLVRMSPEVRDKIATELSSTLKSNLAYMGPGTKTILSHFLEDLTATHETIVETSATKAA